MGRTLRGLFDLFKAGVLSESEFNTKKWDVLARSERRPIAPSAPAPGRARRSKEK